MINYCLANRLKQLRIAKNYTQSYVSSQLHLTRSSYCNYENGIRTPPIDSLIALAKFYEVSIDSLTGFSITQQSSSALSTEERFLIATYRKLSTESQKELLSFAVFKKNLTKSKLF